MAIFTFNENPETFQLGVSTKAKVVISWTHRPTDSIDWRGLTSDPTAKSASKLPVPIAEAMTYKVMIHISNK